LITTFKATNLQDGLRWPSVVRMTQTPSLRQAVNCSSTSLQDDVLAPSDNPVSRTTGQQSHYLLNTADIISQVPVYNNSDNRNTPTLHNITVRTRLKEAKCCVKQ